MNSFELNKILGAVLGTCLVLLVVHIASGALLTPPVPAKPGYVVAVKEEQPKAGGKENGAPAAAASIDTLLASASVEHGAKVAKECLACHNFAKSQGNKVGPNLYGVVGRPVATEPGFNYTAALKAKGGTWTFEALNTWLTNPRADVPGTAMTFAGISNAKQRADVIDYLNSNSDKPLPLPKAAQNQPANPPAANASPSAPKAGGQDSTPEKQGSAPQQK